MDVMEILLVGVGLSMDAFAVSVCKGLSVPKLKWKHILIPALYFGSFQALMPLVGWVLGYQFQSLITSVDHWIAFGLLLAIGANMIREAAGGKDEGVKDGGVNGSFAVLTMLALAVATSIDALAIGITFAFLEVNIWLAIAVIGCTTFVLSAAGVWIGNAFGAKFQRKAEILGGVILIWIGVKTLLEHLGALP